MSTCKECLEDFPTDEMTWTNGWTCKDCLPKKRESELITFPDCSDGTCTDLDH